mgnify:CR=1 FL=1
MNNFKFLLVLLISYNLITNVYSKSVEILIKVQNEIITNIDLENEIKYLLFMNPKLDLIWFYLVNPHFFYLLIHFLNQNQEFFHC